MSGTKLLSRGANKGRRRCEMAATISSLPHAVMSASALLSIGVGLGALLEYLASHRVLGLHRVPLGPGGGADITLASIGSAGLPAPYGHHGWLPVPLGLIDVALLWNAAPVWDSSSWWSTCRGPLWGQLASLAVCLLGVLPAVLAAWLLWMPWRCSALPCALAALLAALAALATLFWADALPLLPRARLTAPCARAALRRSVLYLLHPAYFAARVATAQPEAYDGCTTLSDQLAREPDAVLGALAPSLARPIHAPCADDGSLMDVMGPRRGCELR